MNRLVFARWGTALEDLRKDPETDRELASPLTSLTKNLPNDVQAVMSGKGILVFDGDFDFVHMIREYVKQIQSEYCCGKCLTGIKGTKMLLHILDEIAQGNGSNDDLLQLERIADILDASAKCSVCQSSGELIKDGLKHYRDHFDRAIQNGLPDVKQLYMAKISAPCMTTCPCHINIPDYVEYLQEIRYNDSLRIIRKEMPLPGITGRVCPAPCEKACTLANMGDQPIPIKVLKRVAADYEMDHKLTPPVDKIELTGPPVAVVGAGPAGLSTAYYLNRMGHPVTIFEVLAVPGGMVGVGIPPYRQPRDVLSREIQMIVDMGVTLEQGIELGKDVSIDALFQRGFKAVFLGVGSHKAISLGIKGEEEGFIGVFKSGIDFLRDINLGNDVTIGDRVVIVGGGNTAIDCARTCLRMGATEVFLVYRRTEKEMPSDPHEVKDALEEGIQCHFLTQPVDVVSEQGRMTGLKCIQMELGEPDWSGRRRPVPVDGSEFLLEADTLIPAIGQKTELSFLSPDDGISVTKWGTIEVDDRTLMTSRPGVFAAGDAVSGPLTVVHGVAGGKLAAKMIHDYVTYGKCEVKPEQYLDDILAAIENESNVLVTSRSQSRLGGNILQKKLDRRERISSFEEVETGFTQYGSFVESSRCLRCYHLVLAAINS